MTDRKGTWALLLVGAVVVSATQAFAQDWKATVTNAPAGAFPPLRPLHAVYRFGWGGITAATADVQYTRNNGRSLLTGKVQTTDSVRTLWPFEADYSSMCEPNTLRPVEVRQNENARNKRTSTELTFDANGVHAKRFETKNEKAKNGTKHFEFPNVRDLQSALLYVRSQPLANGSSYRLVVFPGKDPYLTTITVQGREHIDVAAGSYNAIKADVQLSKIGKNMELKPHKKVRKTTVWLSDDNDRILLRAEAEVFVGSVFAELQSAEFQNAAPQIKHD